MKLDNSKPSTVTDKNNEHLETEIPLVKEEPGGTSPDADTAAVSHDGEGDTHVNNDEIGEKEANDNKSVNKVKKLSKAGTDEDDLGIYDDTDDGDDLTDTEAEIERLRAEKKAREEEEQANVTKEHDESEHINQIKPKETDKPSGGVFLTETNAGDQTDRTSKSVTLVDADLTKGGGSKSKENDKLTNTEAWADKHQYIQGVGIRSPSGNQGRPHTTNMAVQMRESRNASRLALESREAMFRRAMSLLTTRCNSVRQNGDLDKPLPFGYQMPKYFYVTQEKPVPMKPLKAWRGYNGNVYFEPININPLKSDVIAPTRASTTTPRQRDDQKPVITPRAMSEKEVFNQTPVQAPIVPATESRNESRQSNKSSNSVRASTRQMAILDKQQVLNRFNESIQEDMIWLEGQENTGSLAVRPKTFPDKRTKAEERDMQVNKERLRKGSVVHKLYVDNKNRNKPRLTVNGGKFTPPNSLSPLLRTQTQYSLSSQRLTTNSPDPYHLHDSKLPPLDQIRQSLKHMDNKNEAANPRGKAYSRSVTLTDDMKPFIKYSPDALAKFAQHTNTC